MDETDLPNVGGESLTDLCRRVEETTGITPSTAGMFEKLTVAVSERTGVLLSPTTLKRIWGYLKEDAVPRRTTLDVLARCCGWQDYTDFEAGNVPEIESGPVGGGTLRVDSDVKRGDRLRLRWAPARVCVIEYSGEGRWLVVESQGTRLKPGDTFCCRMIVSGEPLYLDDLRQASRREKESPSRSAGVTGMSGESRGTVYVCGRRSGVNFERMGKRCRIT